MTNVDTQEIAKFEAVAQRWWDRNGEFKPLHDLNPLRLNYINERTPLAGKKILDVGCGGGILSEGLAFRGAEVTGIDMGQAPLDIARAHAEPQNLNINYRQIPVEQLAAEMPGAFDIVTCMEMLEHVPDPASVVQACATLVKPGGHVFFSTLNRNPKAYLLAIVGAEYVLNMVPRGTHDYLKFIKPSELASWARAAGLQVKDVSGLTVNPFSNTYRISKDADVNYFIHTQKIA